MAHHEQGKGLGVAAKHLRNFIAGTGMADRYGGGVDSSVQWIEF